MSRKQAATLIREYHDADSALWSATAEGFNDALARFCGATDAVVTHCDTADRHDLAGPISDYRDALLSACDERAGKYFPDLETFLREVAAATNTARRKCLSAL